MRTEKYNIRKLRDEDGQCLFCVQNGFRNDYIEMKTKTLIS